MLYKVFIDESGKKEYKNPYSKDFISNPPLLEKYEDFWRDNYFVLCGVRVKQKELVPVSPGNSFSSCIVRFPVPGVRCPFPGARSPFPVVFDKRFYGDAKRQKSEGIPLLKTAQILFERLQYAGNYHIVIFDQMESSLKLTIGHHDRILNVLQKNAGMEKIYVDQYDKITDIKFMESCGENFLQIADVCTYNIFRQFVEFGREWTGQSKSKDGKVVMSAYSYFDRIRCNFLYNPFSKQVRGVGLTCVPDIDKVNWSLLDDCFNNKKTPQK